MNKAGSVRDVESPGEERNAGVGLVLMIIVIVHEPKLARLRQARHLLGLRVRKITPRIVVMILVAAEHVAWLYHRSVRRRRRRRRARPPFFLLESNPTSIAKRLNKKTNIFKT